MVEEAKKTSAEAESGALRLVVQLLPNGQATVQGPTHNLLLTFGMLGIGLFLTIKNALESEPRIVKPPAESGFLASLRRFGPPKRKR